MKILLVNPPSPGQYHLYPPLGMGYVGSALKARGHEVRVLDCYLQDKIDGYKPDWVGITGLSPQYPAMKELARWGKSLGAVVVMGGIHASSLPEFVLKDCPEVDYVVKGEGELAFPDLVEGKAGPGVYSRNGCQESIYIQDLDSLASPWETLNLEVYSGPEIKICGVSGRRYPVASVLSSRGCPYGCIFCSQAQVHGKRIRLRSAKNFLDEIEYLVRERGMQEIQIVDDNFTFNYDHAYSIVQGIIDRRLDITWALPNGIRADRVDKKLLEKMRESGCYYFSVGIESGSPEVLRRANKGLSLEKVEETVREAGRLGFVIHGYFMVGLPGETASDIRETVRFASRIPLDRISVNPVVPFPGSELFSGIEPSSFNWLEALRERYGISEESRRAIRKLYLRFYLNPRRLYRHVTKIKSLSEFVGLFRGFGILVKEISRNHA